MVCQSFLKIGVSGKWIAPVLLSAWLVAGCGSQNEYVPPPPPVVTVDKPVQQAVTNYAEFTGTTRAVESVQIRARVEGYLQSIHFKASAQVKKGDLLFVIDPRPFQAKLDEAKAELARQQAQLKLADATLKRKEMAFKARAVSEVEVIQARAERDAVNAAIEAAKAAIQTARLNLSYTQIHAPISGRIDRNLVDVGNLVGASERTLLATIVKDDPIYAYFNVSERDLLYYQKHHHYQTGPTNGNGHSQVYLGLSNQKGYPYEGSIDYVDNRLDETTGTLQVRGIFPNPDHLLLPGLFARIRVPIGNQENALLVPDRALGTDQRGEYLLVVNDQNVVEYRAVQTGVLVDTLRVIEEGLAPDDRVIVNGLQRARPGLTVNPVEAKTQGTASSNTAMDTSEGAQHD